MQADQTAAPPADRSGDPAAERQAILGVASGGELRARFIGQGPPVLLLHASPRSSGSLLPLARALAPSLTCVLFDSPGFGLSSPLAMARPEIEDFADVLMEGADALGLPALPVYGTHTGAALAAAAVVRRPERTTAAILDGYALFDAAEQAELLSAYLPPFRPTLDGTHVAWLWARVRDQMTAFPWNQVSDAQRLPYGPPPPEVLQEVVKDFLLAGDHYRAGYAAAFRYDLLAALRAAERPMHLIAPADDMLAPLIPRAEGQGEAAVLHAPVADREALFAQIAELMGAAATGDATDAETLAAAARGAEGARLIANTSAGPVVVRRDGPAATASQGRVAVLLHDAPGGMADLDGLAERLARHRAGPWRVIRLNLPGLAVSPLAPGAAPTVETLARGASEAIAAAGAAGAPVLAQGAAVPVALALEGAPPILALDPWPQAAPEAAAGVPDVSPRWDGGHLSAAFWWARDHEIYKPHDRRENAAARSVGPERDAERIHARFRAICMGGEAGADLVRTLYRADASEALAAARDRAEALLFEDDPDIDALRGWAEAALGEARVRARPRAAAALAEAAAEALARLS